VIARDTSKDEVEQLRARVDSLQKHLESQTGDAGVKKI